MALNLEEETVGAVILGDASAIKEGDTVKTTGRVVEVPVGLRSSAGSSTRSASRSTTRARSRRPRPAPSSASPPASSFASRSTRRPDGHQGHRCAHPDRPRPARADHRGPPDRQDRDRDRHDHQPEGPGARLHLRRVIGQEARRSHRPSRRSRSTARWSTRSSSPAPRTLPRFSTSHRTPAPPSARRSWRSASRSTDACQGRAVRLRRPVEARVAYREMALLLLPSARPRGLPG